MGYLLWSESLVWLRYARERCPLVGEKEADTNLDRLGTFFWSMAGGAQEPELHLDGRIFLEDEQHIRYRLGLM